MAIYRQLQTTFWSDSYITELTPEQKYFYIYLLTNEKTKQCGIYEITLRAIAFDTGYNVETVEKLSGTARLLNSNVMLIMANPPQG